MPRPSTIDQSEIEHFSSLADQWWDPGGKFRPLHKFNPVRLNYIRKSICSNFGREFNTPKALSGLRILDIGCGGGLLSEPLARMGAIVVGADASETNIEVARIHAERSGLEIDYRTTPAEILAEQGEKFDVVLSMEVVEHVVDVPAFLDACSSMVRSDGLMCVATINRTRKAQALAIFMVENILRWLPQGTHHFEKLVKPEEIVEPLTNCGLEIVDRIGVIYDVFTDSWNTSPDMDVNYMILAKRLS